MLHLALLVLALVFQLPSQQLKSDNHNHQQDSQVDSQAANECNPTNAPQPSVTTPLWVDSHQNHEPTHPCPASGSEDRQPIVLENPSSAWTIGATVATAVATVFLVLVAWLQFTWQRRYVKDTRTIAEAAKESAQAATFSLHKLERPWIIIKLETFEYHILSDEDASEQTVPFNVWEKPSVGRLKLVYKIHNCGRSPARITRFSGSFDAMPRPIPERLRYRPAQGGGDSILGPGDWTIGQFLLDFPPETRRALFHREVDLVLYGHVGYRDVFSKKNHFTRFWCRLDFEYWLRPGSQNTAFLFQGPKAWNSYT